MQPATFGGAAFCRRSTTSDEALLERIQRRARAAGLSLSVGVSTSLPDADAASLDELVERADRLMYEAKMSRKRARAATQTAMAQ